MFFAVNTISSRLVADTIQITSRATKHGRIDGNEVSYGDTGNTEKKIGYFT